ncbi:bacterio-opsin activator HTH domain-containing protein [Natrialba chahannaoensis JCM 10990]|uniref:Bacterio-opsin activator HTH domain-containing protein n=1 Tax=Natrialba chahannaoensis JCM 10990 TaxID=1227492 RepID=M0B1Z5_9EURY|nr:helix-turn-helix domain-containing protein [Natrialba chahannaoensis]ELZ04810.1 bacterio-opsin activator HTH domain-containing protein [Natrialba chahannaoensis JCM 10990]
MSTGIRATLMVEDPDDCPAAQLSAEEGMSSRSISKSVDPSTGETVTEELLVEDSSHAESTVIVSASNDDASADNLQVLFSDGSQTVYRFTREFGRGCPCECVERFDAPVVDVHTDDGALVLVFHVPSTDVLQQIVGKLQERYADVTVQRLVQARPDSSEQDLVFVDRSALTARQREVLETANELGYFEYPKRANATEVADALEITSSTFTEHLAAAQRTLLDSVLGE